MAEANGWELLKQARELDMFSAGYVWVVTDGMTTSAPPAGTTDEFDGLIGTVPGSAEGNYTSILFGNDVDIEVFDISLLVLYSIDIAAFQQAAVSSNRFE